MTSNMMNHTDEQRTEMIRQLTEVDLLNDVEAGSWLDHQAEMVCTSLTMRAGQKDPKVSVLAVADEVGNDFAEEGVRRDAHPDLVAATRVFARRVAEAMVRQDVGFADPVTDSAVLAAVNHTLGVIIEGAMRGNAHAIGTLAELLGG